MQTIMTHPRYMKDVDSITLYRKGWVVIEVSETLSVRIEEAGDCEFDVAFSGNVTPRTYRVDMCEEEIVAFVKRLEIV